MRNAHILLADDEVHLRYTLTLILKRSGYRVTSVGNGIEAYESIKQFHQSANPVHLLVLDIQMPGMTGVELLEALRDDELYIPTIVITGYGTREIRVQLFDMGVFGYIEKPFDPHELLEQIDQVFEKKRTDEKARTTPVEEFD